MKKTKIAFIQKAESLGAVHTCSFKKIENHAIFTFQNKSKKDNLCNEGQQHPLLM